MTAYAKGDIVRWASISKRPNQVRPVTQTAVFRLKFPSRLAISAGRHHTTHGLNFQKEFWNTNVNLIVDAIPGLEAYAAAIEHNDTEGACVALARYYQVYVHIQCCICGCPTQRTRFYLAGEAAQNSVHSIAYPAYTCMFG